MTPARPAQYSHRLVMAQLLILRYDTSYLNLPFSGGILGSVDLSLTAINRNETCRTDTKR